MQVGLASVCVPIIMPNETQMSTRMRANQHITKFKMKITIVQPRGSERESERVWWRRTGGQKKLTELARFAEIPERRWCDWTVEEGFQVLISPFG